jgi:hypothetical protein
MVLGKGHPLVSSLAKVHYLDSPLLVVDSASAGDLLPSTTGLELGYLHQTPDVLETKIQSLQQTLTLKADIFI